MGRSFGTRFELARHGGERWHPIDVREYLLRDDTGGNLPRPSDHGGHPHASLKRRVHEIAAKRPVREPADLRYRSTGRVVAAEDEDRVVLHTRFLDRVKHLPDAIVHLCEEVGECSAALDGLASEILAGDGRRMHFGIADVDEEWLPRRSVALDEVDGLGDDVFPVHEGPHVQIERHHRLGRLALLPLPKHGRLLAAILELRPCGIAGLVPRVLGAPPLVIAHVGRQPALDVAEVIFAIERGGVTGVGEELGDRVFPWRQTSEALAGPRDGVGPRTDRVAPCVDRRPRRRALRLNVIIIELNALVGQLIDAWRRRGAAVHAKASPADVVDQKEHDVGFFFLRQCRSDG